VRADDAAQLAGIEHEAQVIERAKTVEADGDVVDPEHGMAHAARDRAGGAGERRRGSFDHRLHVCAHAAWLAAWGGVCAAAGGWGEPGRGAGLRRRARPAMPLGKNSVTITNNAPRKNSQKSGYAAVR